MSLRLPFLFFFAIFFSIGLNAQSTREIYVGIQKISKNQYYAFVELIKDSAHVQLLCSAKGEAPQTVQQAIIARSSNTFAPFSNEQISITSDFDKYTTTLKVDTVPTKIEIRLAKFEDSPQIIDAQKNEAYYNDKSVKDILLLDSLIGKGNYLVTEYTSAIEKFRSNDTQMELNTVEFIKQMDQVANKQLAQMLHRDEQYIAFLKNLLNKNEYSEAEIDEFVKRSKYDKLIETEILTHIFFKSSELFLGYLDKHHTLTENKELIQELKDLAFIKANKKYYKDIKHVLHTSFNEHHHSKHQIKHIFRKTRRKLFRYRVVYPIIGTAAVGYVFFAVLK